MFFLTVSFLVSAVRPGFAQKYVVIDDRAQFLSESVESSLGVRLKDDSLELTSVIDSKKRCEYWFATMYKTGSELYLSIIDCNDRIAGKKNLGTVIFSASDSEKTLLLYFAVSEIIKNPYRLIEQAPSSQNIQSLPSPGGLVIGGETIISESDPGQHRSRYFFSPSSFNLEKGELYYNTMYFLVHDVQYGLSDQFSMGMGTTVIGFPFYVTPKFTMPINKKSALALGDMLVMGTYATRFTGNLLYLTYTRGDVYKNFTIGAGFLTFGGKDISNEVNAPVLNFAVLSRISDHIYFVTENYFSLTNPQRTGYHYITDINTGYQTYYEEYFNQKSFYMYNLIGFRFLNKNKDVKCWQIGLSFIVGIFEELPAVYKPVYNYENYWYTEAPGSNRFFPIPVIAYSRKFSTKY